MIIRIARIDEYPGVLKRYKTCNYGGGVNLSGHVIIAIDNQIICAVRICMTMG